MILCDEFGFRRSIAEAGALSEISNSYMMLMPSSSRTLHAKVCLMASQDKIALLIGSGNLTQSGFMQNLELFDVIQLSLPSAPKLLLDDIQSFVDGLESHCSDLSLHYSLLKDFFAEIKGLIQEFNKKINDTKNSDIRLLSSFKESFFDQLAPTVSDSDLYVASPYFGGSTEGFSMLYNALQARSAHVYPGIDRDGFINVPFDQLMSFPNTKVCTLKLDEGQKFPHLKLYGFRKKEEKDAWLFNGSVNCTKAALSGNNIEAGILRKVSLETIDAYFVEGEAIGTPAWRTSHYKDSDEKWISIVAANLGNQIELVACSTVECPISQVNITLTSGSKGYSAFRDKLFSHGLIEKLEWTKIGVEQHKSGAVFMLEVSAVDAKGDSVRGACYIHDFFALSSDPANRSALRAAHVLLSGDNPSTNDIAAIFQLLDPFRSGGFLDVQPVDTSGKDISRRVKENTDDEKIPLWPPVLLKWDAGSWFRSHQLSQTYWLQRIMDQLFSSSYIDLNEESEDVPETEAPEKAKGKALPKAKKKDKENFWLAAHKSFDSLREKMKHLVITESLSQKLLPFSLTTFLLFLASRKNYLNSPENKAVVKLPYFYVNEYLSMLFFDRIQDTDYVRPKDCRYKHKIFPAISSDIHSNYSVNLTSDLCSIIFALFLYLKALDCLGHHRGFPLLPWLRFRELASTSLDDIHLERTRMEAIYKRYLTDEDYPMLWPDIERYIHDLLNMSWKDFDSYADLTILLEVAAGKTTDLKLRSPHLIANYELFKHRLKMKLQPFYEADRLVDYCKVNNCSKANIVDPAKKALSSLSPVICEGCGSLLIPDELYQNYLRHKDDDRVS